MIAPVRRLELLVAVVVVLVTLQRRIRIARTLRFFDDWMRSAWPIALAALCVSVGFLLLRPPAIAVPWHSPLAVPTAQSRPDGNTPDVYLITLDALSAVDANVCGSGRTLMPRLRQLATTSTCFARAYASSNFTNPTTATLETGVLPWTHWATQVGAHIAQPIRDGSLGAVLTSAGYLTNSVSANLTLI